jgi:hypothetical protein
MAPENRDDSGLEVLRIGILQNGRIVEERLVRRRQDVTVGQSTKNTFVVPGSNSLPRSFRLFELRADGYALHFTEAMDGRVSLGDEVSSLQAMRSAAAPTSASDGWRMQLAPRARGKIVMGDVTVLFQLVAPPAVLPRPQLPVSVRSSLIRNLDKTLAAVVVLSFLAHFGSVAYLRTLDWPRVTDPEALEIDAPKFYPVRVNEPRKVEPASQETAATPTTPAVEPGRVTVRPRPRPVVPTPVASEEDRVAALNAVIARRGVLAQLTSRGKGGLVSDSLRHGRPADNSDEVLKTIGGVDGADGDERPGLHQVQGADDGSHRTTVRKISLLAPKLVRTIDKGPGSLVVVKGHTEAGKAKVDGDLSPELIGGVVRRNLGSLTACYESILKHSGGLAGKITVEMSVSAVGRVTSVEFADDTLGSDEITSCVKARIGNWSFPASKSGATISHPFFFTRAGQ